MASASEDAATDVEEVKFIPDLDFWDPTASRLRKNVTPSFQCLHQIRRDVMDLYAKPIPEVIIVPDDRDITRIYGLLLGPAGTPYEGGFFRYFVKCPPDFPAHPPRVKLLTTDGGRVGFAPNLNEDGMICLSLLGTWPGPVWSPSEHSLRTVLIALQSIMTDDPFNNVPALVRGKEDEARAYKDYLLHETLRVAVIEEVASALHPDSSYKLEHRKFVLVTFLKSYKTHLRTVRLQIRRMVNEGRDPFRGRTTRYDYDFILIRLERLYDAVSELNEKGIFDKKVDLVECLRVRLHGPPR
ncbi:hypothetical protein MRX96_009011 [Rhipicephalus microplus]